MSKSTDRLADWMELKFLKASITVFEVLWIATVCMYWTEIDNEPVECEAQS